MSLRNLLKTILPIIIITGFVALGVGQIQADRELNLENKIELQSKEAQMIELNNKYENVLQQKTDTQKERDEQAKQIRELEQERIRLEKELQAKKQREAAEAERLAEANRRATATRTASAQAPVQSGGNKESWMRSAGIPQSEWWAVDYIVSRESGWNPCAYNPGRSNCNLTASQVDATWATSLGTACGLAQSLPCSKLADAGINWTDPVGNLKWQYNYVTERYGGYPQAVAFWRVNHWY